MSRRAKLVTRAELDKGGVGPSDIVGPCCCCGVDGELPNVLMLDVRGVTPGKGWGCVICGLAPDGAVAGICRRCIPDDWQPGTPRPGGAIRLACTGYVTEPGRVPVAELREPWLHDMSKHTADPRFGEATDA